MGGTRFLLLLFSTILLGASGPVAGEWSVDEGIPRSDPRVARLVGVLDAALDPAFASVEKHLGLRKGERRIEWRLIADPIVAPGDAGFHAGDTLVEKRRIVVRIPAHRYLARPAKARKVVVHEAAHALLASRLPTPRAYAEIPGWFREGIALRASGEGPDRVLARIATKMVEGGSPSGFLRGLSRSPRPAESFLAIRWLEAKWGRRRLVELVSRASKGELFDAALRDTLGVDLAEFSRRARESAEGRIRELTPDKDEEAFRRALRAHAAGRSDEARAVFARLARAMPAVSLTETSAYLEARSLVDRKDFAVALVRLRSLVSKDRESLWEAEILEQLGICSLGLNRREEARRYFDEALERFPEDREVAKRVRARLSRIAPK